MKIAIFSLAILFVISVRGHGYYQEDSDEKELGDSERCELDGYAEDIVNLVLAHETDKTLDLKELVDDKFAQLESYVKLLKTTFRLAIYGANYMYDSNPAHLGSYNKERAKYFILRIKEKVSELFYETCTEDFHQKHSYRYNNNTHQYTVEKQTELLDGARCVCLSYVSGDPCRFNIKYDKKTTKIIPEFGSEFDQQSTQQTVKNHYGGIQMLRHQIIPRHLIMEFIKTLMKSTAFERYFPDDNQFFGQCTIMLSKRLQASLDKIIAYETMFIEPMAEGMTLRYESSVDPNTKFILQEIIKRYDVLSSGGNIFMGPLERGPFDPSARKKGSKKAYGKFQFGTEMILGIERYNEMFDLYTSLEKYVESASETKLFDKFFKGIEILVTLLTTLERYPIAPMKLDQWEHRQLTAKELAALPIDEAQALQGKYFWDIKKLPSTSIAEEESDFPCHTLDGLAQRKWTEFIVESMNTYLKNASKTDFSLPWVCDLTRMYYYYRMIADKRELCGYSTFDGYMYSKISKTQEWHECVHFKETKPAEWCQAWRRIMLNSDLTGSDYWINDARPPAFYDDTEIVIRWLAPKFGVVDSPKYWPDGTSQKYMCYDHTNVTSLGCPNDCDRTDENGNIKEPEKYQMEKVYTLEEGQSMLYGREWYIDDVEERLKCVCPKATYAEWFRQALGDPCGPNSPKKNTARCDEARR